MQRTIPGILIVVGCMLLAPAAATAQSDEGEFEGSVELLYRNVSQSGSSQKYDEDFDGLSSGTRLSSLRASWTALGPKAADFLRLQADGLGGDPYERASLRMGRRDTYELKLNYWKQTYLYNLFDLTGDQDASLWDAERSATDLGLTWHATDKIDLFFEYQDTRRDGRSLFMKTVNTDLFRLETPLDQQVKRYSVGARFEVGPVDVLFRQTLRRYDYVFDNSTEGDQGLSTTDLVTLDQYDWRQTDSGGADLTTMTVSLPLGDRVNLTATAFGTFLGEQDLTSRVALDAQGTTQSGAAYSVAGGSSLAEIEMDYFVLDADVSVDISRSLDLHLQVRALDREVTSDAVRDLDGNGVVDDTEGTINDSTPGSNTRVDYTLNSITGLLEFAPIPEARFRAGYRTIYRDLTRSGFEFGTNEFRNTDYESDRDNVAILGLVLRPTKWLRLNADYEEGDINQAFTAVSPMETDYLRVRARVDPIEGMRLDLSYMDYENSNRGLDFRFDPVDCGLPGQDIDVGCWNSRVTGSTRSAALSHRAGDRLSYSLRWARQEVDSVIRANFDTAVFFGSNENADSVFDNANTQWSGQLRYELTEAWSGLLRVQINDSDGNNSVIGQVFSNTLIIDQDYTDAEVGLTRTFDRGLYVGGRFRVFDYDDRNGLLDYDGEIFTVVAGMNF